MRNLLMSSALLVMSMSMPALATDADNSSTIEVQGYGKILVEPDLAVISLGVSQNAPEAKQAMAEVNEHMRTILDRLYSLGLAPADIRTSQLQVSKDYGARSAELHEVPEYMASSMLTIRVRDLEQLGDVIDLALKDGANQMSGLRFDVADTDQLETRAQTLAVKDAMSQARELADAAGVELGSIRYITASGGVGQPGVMAMARMSAGAPIASGEVSVESHVSMVFDIIQ
jgi:uncharacterized protein YggE